ncbi:hypothetical protein BpHYR1_020404 [Brachionus plicatilis]|uniref:Uncharacterized protein n=1 Tax=Brachionus plicatilis TaxID=10195 RepID=A0A3M7R6H8_BRAPC|nr:hypothetical protein BpHYR1_020404 [Brachionus plicatilis]
MIDFSSGMSTFTSSGSRRRDMPKRLSATLNALFRLKAWLDLFSWEYWIKSGLCLWIRALKAKPSRHDVVKLRTASLAERASRRISNGSFGVPSCCVINWSVIMSWIWNLKIIVQMRPRVRDGLPSTMS